MPRKLTAPTKKPIRLAPVRPNIGLTIAYQARLDRMIDAMQRDSVRQIRRQWRANVPEMAGDESPAAGLRRMMGRLAREWTKRFNDFASTWGRRFTADAVKATDGSFKAALRKAGFTVQFSMTREVNDIAMATVAESVSLIKSIPAEYLKDVEGHVMRSVQTGRALGELTQHLEQTYGVTRRRAAFIAQHQNNMATAAILRARQLEVGIDEAIWMHSLGGRVPRPTHLHNNGMRFSVRDGWLDPAINRRIWPGTLPRCRCVQRAVIPGL